MDVKWQDIVKKYNSGRFSPKHFRDTVYAYYNALESTIDYDCNVGIKRIGKFVGTRLGIQRRDAIKKFKLPKTRFHERKRKKRQRAWAHEPIDKHWPG